MRNRFIIFILMAVLIFIMEGRIGAEETKTDLPHKLFKLNNSSCEEMEPVVKLYLSKDGKAVIVKRLNAILVKDHQENLDKIEMLLKKTDIPSPMVKVSVNFLGKSNYKTSGIYAGAVPYGKYWIIGVQPDFTNSTQDISSTVSLTTMSGSDGFIRFGENVPYRTWFYDYCRRHGYITGEIVQFISVSTGFYVSPRVAGDEIYVKITPGISYFDGSKTGRIKFREVQSEVRVRDGQSVVLGVGDSSDSGEGTLISNIIGGGSYRGNEKFTIMLTVKKVKGN